MNNFDPNFGHVNVAHVNAPTYYTYGPSTGGGIITEHEIDVIASECLAIPQEQVEHYRWDGPAERNYTTPRKRFFQYRGKILQLVSETPGQENTQVGQIGTPGISSKPRRSLSHDLTEEELRERRARHAERERMRRKNMTNEQRIEYLRKEQERRQKNKEKINKARYERNHANWNVVQQKNKERYQKKKERLSDDDRKERVRRQIERQRSKLAQMSAEELEAYKEKMREIGRTRYAKKKQGGDYNPRKKSRKSDQSRDSADPFNVHDRSDNRELSLAPTVSSIPGGARDSSLDPSITANDDHPSQLRQHETTQNESQSPKEKKIYITEHIRHCMLYEFQLGHTVVEATQNIRKAMGQNAITQRLCQQWFNRFKLGNIQLGMIKPKYGVKKKTKAKKSKPDYIDEPDHQLKESPVKRGRPAKTAQKSTPTPKLKRKIKIKVPSRKPKTPKKFPLRIPSDDEEDDENISLYSDNSDVEIDVEEESSDYEKEMPSSSNAKKISIPMHKYPTRTRGTPKNANFQEIGSKNTKDLHISKAIIEISDEKEQESIPERIPEPMSLPAPIQLPDEGQEKRRDIEANVLDDQQTLRTILYPSETDPAIHDQINFQPIFRKPSTHRFFKNIFPYSDSVSRYTVPPKDVISYCRIGFLSGAVYWYIETLLSISFNES